MPVSLLLLLALGLVYSENPVLPFAVLDACCTVLDARGDIKKLLFFGLSSLPGLLRLSRTSSAVFYSVY